MPSGGNALETFETKLLRNQMEPTTTTTTITPMKNKGVVEGMAQQQSWKSLNRPISTNPTTTSRTITTIITTAVLACAEVASPDGASSNILT